MSVMASDGTLTQLRDKLLSLHRKHKSWRKVADLPEFKDVAPGTLCSIAKGDYEPKDNEIRKRLGLPIAEIQYRSSITGRYVEKSK